MNKSIDVFPWNKKFDTGLAEIDVQHQKLVELLNKLACHVASPLTPTLDEVFNELAQYAEYHFSTEEAIWKRYFEDDDWNLAHQTTHSGFIHDVLKIKLNEEGVCPEEEIERIILFLKNWLAFHIIESDKRMAKVVLEMQKGSSLSEAKSRILAEIFGP